MDILVSALVAAGLIFVAELGDKSQLLSLWFATRYRLVTVFSGVAFAIFILMVLAVVVGAVFGAVLPERLFLTIAALLFFGFAAWTLRRDDDEAEEGVERRVPFLGPFGIVAVSLVVSEMGDKTQIATIALAGNRNPIGVFIGAWAGMFAAISIAVVIGKVAGRRLPRRAISIGAGILFAAFGAITLWEAWR